MANRGPLEADTCRGYVLPRLEAAGWSRDQITEQFPVTDGRIIQVGRRHRRDKPLRADYVLQAFPGMAVAVVEAKREYRMPADGLQQGKRYAEMLDLPLAYGTNGTGIVEHDYDTGREALLDAFPSPDAAWRRFQAWKGITSDQADALALPFSRALRNADGTVKEPRYYQRVAIQRSLQGILAGDKRLLLTMATGSGKSFVAMQVVWKLWAATGAGTRKPRVLYLADRNILVDQPIAREFKPVFGDAIWKLQGDAQMGRDLYFALYQALGDTPDGLGIFREYPRDYFDLIVVDECHRGSARDESNWRSILEYFEPAAQLGMTATPLRSDNVDTYRYFGDPIYMYSLKQGIDDGFLAPYRVRRVVLSADAFGYRPDEGQLDLFGREIPEQLYETRHFERVVSLLSRTGAAAAHLTSYLKRTDRMAKTIVFCVDSEHADQMRRALNNANADLTRQHPDYVVRIVSAEGDVGAEHLGRFADPESDTPVIATTSKLLSTGVDMPTVANVVLFKPIGSIVEFKQIIGRGTRLYPDADKLSFEIIDYSGATALFEDPDFDGPPEQIVEETIDVDGAPVAEANLREDTEELLEQAGGATPESLEERRAQKLYVDDTEVFLVAEGFYLPDPDSGLLRLVEYGTYVADEVRRLFPNGPQELRAAWSSEERRADVVRRLRERGVAFEEVAERIAMEDSDPFDVLVHLAWNRPLTTRHDRARRVRADEVAFFEAFRSDAREVLDALLEQYAASGPSELTLESLRVPPVSDLGTPIEIAARFGGPDRLRSAVDRLQELLYAA